jgi:hypothetical protein
LENIVKKQHYFLIAGQVIFHTKDGETGQVMLNGIVTNDTRNFPARLIGKAQQILQLLFFKKIEDPTVTVVDVPIYSVSHLGIMTEKEFHAAPEGMKLAEKVGADPFADADTSKAN